MCKEELAAGERMDDLQYKGLQLIQSESLFSFGTDAVLLAHFTQLHKGELLVDLGTGTGILPVLLAGRSEGRIIGVEIQQEAAALARRNMMVNGLAHRVTILDGDLKDAPRLIKERVDAVVANPPYEKLGAGAETLRPAEKIARVEVCCTLRDVLASASTLLKTKGRFTMVYRPSRLAELFYEAKRRKLEPKVLQLVFPKAKSEPNLVLLKCIKGAKEGLRILPPLIIHREDGRYTQELNQIYHREDIR